MNEIERVSGKAINVGTLVNLGVGYEEGGGLIYKSKKLSLHIGMDCIDSNVSLESLGVPTP